MKVRRATTHDLDVLIAMGERMIEESVIPYPPIEPDRVESLLQSDFPDMVFLIAESGGPCGFMVALMASPVFSTQRFAFHHVFYVAPEKRGSKAAYMLVRAYEEWAVDNGADHTEICVDTGLFPERTGKFYEKMGYEYMGGKYKKEWVH